MSSGNCTLYVHNQVDQLFRKAQCYTSYSLADVYSGFCDSREDFGHKLPIFIQCPQILLSAHKDEYKCRSIKSLQDVGVIDFVSRSPNPWIDVSNRELEL